MKIKEFFEMILEECTVYEEDVEDEQNTPIILSPVKGDLMPPKPKDMQNP